MTKRAFAGFGAAKGQNGLADFLCSVLDLLHDAADADAGGLVAALSLGEVLFAGGDELLDLLE